MNKRRLLAFFAMISIFSSASIFNASAVTTTDTSTVKMSIQPTISLTLSSNSLSISGLTPGSLGNSNQITISVTTNNLYGYSLNATVGNSTYNSTDLVKTGSSSVFSMLGTGTFTASTFTDGSWGYSVDSGSTYGALSLYSTTGTLLNSSDAPATSDTTNFQIGAKADMSVVNGTYNNIITFSAVTNAPPPSISTISNMQEMTASICDESALNETNQLIDTRDNKLYWVTKLADGNCWMTQNLDYDIKADGTDIISTIGSSTTSTWSTSATYAPQATSTSVFNSSDKTGTYSYDPGSAYLPNGSGTATAITCTSASNGGENCHYHQGNYYQWNAATAGTGGTISGADATSSICPKGWRLPTQNGNSFSELTNAYGIAESSSGSSDSSLIASPLFFVRGGHVWSGAVYNIFSGHYWSSTACTGIYTAYDLEFASSRVLPNYDDYRYSGLSVRCVAE